MVEVEFTWDLDEPHDITCCQCGYKFQKTWREIETEDKFNCSDCRAVYLGEAIQSLRQSIMNAFGER